MRQEDEIDEAGEMAAGDYKPGIGIDLLASCSSEETRRVSSKLRTHDGAGGHAHER